MSSTPSHLFLIQEQFVRHHIALRGFLFGLVGDAHLIDDVIQETFLTACEKAETFTAGTNFRAWIFTIARYKALGAIKQRTKQPASLDPDVIELLAESHEPQGDLPERVLALNDCVGRLSRSTREAVTLRYAEELGPTEIAARIGWSVNAVNVALSRARLLLKQCVDQKLRAVTKLAPEGPSS